MSETADIVIIGAGIVGCSLAYHLALQGTMRIAVVDKDLICSGSTRKSAGGIRQQFATDLNIRLSLESIRMFERMPEELGVDPGFRRVGYLFLASTNAEQALFRQNVALQQRHGVPVQRVGPATTSGAWSLSFSWMASWPGPIVRRTAMRPPTR